MAPLLGVVMPIKKQTAKAKLKNEIEINFGLLDLAIPNTITNRERIIITFSNEAIY